MKLYFYYSVFALLAVSQFASGQTTSNLWGPATNNLKMSMSPIHDVSSFSSDDIMFWSPFIERLRRQADPVSAFLWQRLTTNEHVILMNYQSSQMNSSEAQDVVVHALNRIIGESLIFDQQRFKDIVFGSETARIRQQFPLASIQQAPPGPFLAHFNRLLLEDAYPVELSRRIKPGEPIFKQSESVMLTITITNMSTNETYYATTGVPIEDGMTFSCDVITPSGNRITPQGAPSRVRKSSFVRLAPHESPDHSCDYNVSHIYKFEEIGTYIIIMNCLVDWPGGKKQIFDFVDPDGNKQHFSMDEFFKVVSNPLSIKIVPDN